MQRIRVPEMLVGEATIPQAPWPVLILVQETGQGGSERQAAATALSLDRRVFAPHLGCMRPGGFRHEELRAAGVPVVGFPLRSMKSPSVVAHAVDLRAYIRENKIRLVHAFDVPMNLFGILGAAGSGVPRLASLRAHRGLSPRLVRPLLSLCDRVAHGVVVNCEAMRRHAVDDLGIDPAKVRLCHNSIDTAEFSAAGRIKPPEFRGAKVVVGVVCALRPEKDVATLIAAFERVQRPDTILAVCGSGPCEADLRLLADRLGIGASVVFVPMRADVAPLLRGIDIFVLPSRSEAFSNSLMEAMACGCAPVASRVGGNPELLEDGAIGLLFPPEDDTALAGCLERLLDDPRERVQLAGRAERRVAERFSREAASQRMERIYRDFLTQDGPVSRVRIW